MLYGFQDGGKVLGIKKNAYYQQGVIELLPKDLVVCYTDGITESHNCPDSLFGKEKLYDIVKKNSRHSVRYIKEAIFHEVDAFLGISDSHDDRALVIFKRKNSK